VAGGAPAPREHPHVRAVVEMDAVEEGSQASPLGLSDCGEPGDKYRGTRSHRAFQWPPGRFLAARVEAGRSPATRHTQRAQGLSSTACRR
jgi:hypothetical protein